MRLRFRTIGEGYDAMAGSDTFAGSAGPAGHAPLQGGSRPALSPLERVPGEPSQDHIEGGAEIGLSRLQQGAGNAAVSSMLSSPGDLVRSVVSAPGRPLDSSTSRFVQTATGRDPSGIQLHEGPLAAEAARSVGAEMFASGSHLVAPQGLDVTTMEGAFKAVHEVHHIVNQQAHGAVEGTETSDGLKISDPGDRHEREADTVAADAVAARFMS